MSFAKLRVRLPDEPGELAALAGTLAEAGVDIVSIDAQHAAGGAAIDVLSVRLPDDVSLPELVSAVETSRRELEVTAAWADKDALTDRVVRALDTTGRLLAGPADHHAIEAAFARLLDASRVWVVPVPPQPTGLLARTATTGMPATTRTAAIRLGGGAAPDGGAAATLLTLPIGADVERAVLVARESGDFTDSEIARGLALARVVATLPPSADRPSDSDRPAVRPRTVRAARTRLTIRSAAPTDRVGLLELHARCSEASLRNRFFSGMPVLASRHLDHLVGAGPGERVDLVVEDPDGELIAVGNLVATPMDATDAEVALLVTDAWQGQRVGTALLDLLRQAAADRGWGTLTAQTLPDNVALQRLLAPLPGARTRRDGRALSIDFPSRDAVPAGGAR